METLKEVLMERDGVSSETADQMIEDARVILMEALEEGRLEDAYEVCADEFGLEPDYLMYLI